MSQLDKVKVFEVSFIQIKGSPFPTGNNNKIPPPPQKINNNNLKYIDLIWKSFSPEPLDQFQQILSHKPWVKVI